jgi:hypothetical protein
MNDQNLLTSWFDLATSRDFLDPHFAPIPYVLFCLVAGISAVAVLHLDKSLVDANRQSIMQVTYDKPIWRMSLIWFRGAFIAALIGGALQIWKPSLYAAVVVGLTWQLLLAQFLETVKRHSQPVQAPQPDADEAEEYSDE